MELAKHWAAKLDDYAIDLAWSPDGALLAAASSSGSIPILSSTDGAERHLLQGDASGTNALAFMPAAPSSLPPPASHLPPPLSVLASAGQDGSVKFWDAATGQHTATAALGSAWVEHLAWRGAPGTAPVLAAAAGRKLAFLKADGSVLRILADAPKTISALAWQPRPFPSGGAERPLLACAWFGAVRLADADDSAAGRDIPYANGVQALAWSPEGKWLVAGNQDPSVHLWLPAEDVELQMSGYETKVKHLSFDCTGWWLATAGGRDACIWDCSGAGPEGRAPAMFPHETAVTALAFQNAHGLLATASQGGEVQIWSPERRQPLRAAARLEAAVTKLAWSPDDRMLAIGSDSGTVHVLRCQP